jgi:protein XRP2
MPQPAAPVVNAPASKPSKPEPKSVDTLYELSRWKGKEFLRYNQITGQQIQLEYLEDCKVYVLDALDSMYVDDCQGGELFVSACEGSIFLRNCKNMTVSVACKQLRLRDCEHLDIRLFATTDPVVEMSHHIVIKPFNVRAPGLTEAFRKAKLDPAINRFVHVYDFTAEDPKLPRPHFTVLFPEHGLTMQSVCVDVGVPEAPDDIEALLHGKLEPAPSSESGQNKSMNIKTGAAAWTAPPPAAKGPEKTPQVVMPTVIAPTAVPPAKTPQPAPSAVPDGNYSSFSESSSSESENDKYRVEEDDDEF